MERVSLVQLNSALKTIAEPSRRRLPDEEYSSLVVMFGQMQTRYPSQDLEEATEGYLSDYEQLCLRYSLRAVRDALAELRISPRQRFFPRPDEVAEVLKVMRDEEQSQFAAQRQQEARQRKIAEFWPWAEEWMRDTGNDEVELLRRFPSMRGTKPGASAGHQGSNVVSMPSRDLKTAAGGADFDGAA